MKLWLIALIFLVSFIGHTPIVFANSIQQIEHANELYQAKDWQKAVKAYEEITQDNPYNGKYWSRLGGIYYELAEHEAAITAYSNAIDVGFQVGNSAYNIAHSFALMGNVEETLVWLKTAKSNTVNNLDIQVANDPDFDAIRQHHLFLDAFPSRQAGLSRKVGWQMDLIQLSNHFKTSHYSPFTKISQAQFDQLIESLSHNIESLDDDQIIVQLMKIVTSIGDGHSIVVPPMDGQHQFHRAPIQLREFEDSFYVVATAPEYASILGHRLTAIESTPINEVMELMTSVVSHDNSQGIRWMRPKLITVAEILYGLYITTAPNSLTMTFEKQDLELFQTFELIPFSENILDRVPTQDWIFVNRQAALPIWLQHANDPYYLEKLHNSPLVYAQINQIQHSENFPLDTFLYNMVDMLDTHGAGLILDLRLNNGGEVGLNSWILQAVRRSKSIERGAPFYILIGPRTFSAGMNLAVDLDWHTRAIFVGEPTGSSLVHFGQDNFTQLANSGLRVSAASRRFQGVASDDQRKWIAPDIYIPLTFSDFESHDDPVLREIVDYTTAHISP